jgi:hypothetical protein
MTTPPKNKGTRTLPIALATFLAIANGVFWLWVVDTGYPVPLEAYADPTSTPRVVEAGRMQFDMCSHCGRGFILAGREPRPLWLQDSSWVRAGTVANVPGHIVARIAGKLVEDFIGQYGAMWAETVAFALATTAQWAFVGWTLGGIVGRVASLRFRDQQS